MRSRFDIYSAFSAPTVDARRVLINRWYQRSNKGRGSLRYEAAKSETYRVRTAARRARVTSHLQGMSRPAPRADGRAVDAAQERHLLVQDLDSLVATTVRAVAALQF